MPGVLAAASSKLLKQSVITLFSHQMLVLPARPWEPVARASVIDCCEDVPAAFHAGTVDTMSGRIQGEMMSTAPGRKRCSFVPVFSTLQGYARHMSNTFRRVTRQTFPNRCS